jgi:Na+/melibiose symporter-like transporter
LPLLGWLGYTPGTTQADALSALTLAYAALPCALKFCAAVVLWRAPLSDV